MNDIGLIGLAVMGRNLAFNIADNGYNISVYNRSKEPVDDMKKEYEKSTFKGKVEFCYDLKEFVNSLSKPRKIILLIKAGAPVDMTIEKLLEYVEEGDIIIDGGNSFFKDTERRYNELKEKKISYVGLGISGGELGARFGPAMMPGCDKEVYDKISNILEDISAKYNSESCCRYTSVGGAGHYVKMVHNGIEYGDMQLIAEAYSTLSKLYNLDNEEISNIFSKWNEGLLKSYLVEITADLLKQKDDLSDGYLVDKILDISMQKGTGKWTTIEACELGVDISVIAAGLNARYMSMLKLERVEASKILSIGRLNSSDDMSKDEFISSLEMALFCAKIISYAQGFKLLRVAESEYNWSFDLGDVSKIFRAGCIIRAELLANINDAYVRNPKLENLMLDEHFSNILTNHIKFLRAVIIKATNNGIACPALSAALNYYDAYRTENSNANIIQAQRDYFGAHTYNRNDREGTFHHNWNE